ncbi:hypothetical protein DFH11DRAFT_1518291 [Phellopilus nigrolimitatus]|nr:hypothetical protein DFH11DRAFT_1518291 [Phellopilus nigrolimitatus]
MAQQTFIGDTPVDALPASATRKADEDALTRAEARRNPAVQPGANKRQGVASRDPADFDTARRGGQGNTQPQNGERRASVLL